MHYCVEVNIGLPADSLPRQRKAPKKLNDYYRVDACASSVSNEFDSTQQHYRQAYYETIDLIIRSIEEKFDQDTMRYLYDLEGLIISSLNGEFNCQSTTGSALRVRFPVLVGDIDFDQLLKELPLLPAT